jgi:hypothetical protein
MAMSIVKFCIKNKFEIMNGQVKTNNEFAE